MLVSCLFVVNNLFSQLPEKGDYKTRVGITAPSKVQDWMPVIFNRPPYTDPHAEVDSLSYVEFYRAFKSLADNAPYVDYTFYSGAFSEPQVDRNTKKTLETSIYDKLLLNFQDPAIRLLIIEDILSLGRNFIDNLDSVNVVRNNRDASEKAASDTLSLPVAMTKYAHLYYKYASNPAYYPAHLYDFEQARENYRNAFKMLRDRNIDPGSELEGFYVNEYYKTCEELFKSNEEKYYEQFLEDYLEIVQTCDNLLIPFYDIPDSIKNYSQESRYLKFQSYNYYTNHNVEGVKALFKASGAAAPERLNDYYMAQLKDHRKDTTYLNRAINVLNENGCSQTPAFYSYCEASYMIKPTYMNCIGCAFASKEDGLRDDMINYFVEAYDLATTDLQRGLIAYQIGCANNTPIPTTDIKSAEYSKWVNDMNTAYSNLKKVLDVQMAFSESPSIQVREIPARTAFELAQNRYRLRYTLTSIAEMDEAAKYVKLAMEAAPDLYNNPVNQIGPKLMNQITERRQKLIADAKNTAVRKAQEKAYAEYLKKKQAEDAFWNQQ
jgi:hypothetical protein